MLFAITLACGVLTLALSGSLPAWLHHLLVELPARKLLEVRRIHLLLAIFALLALPFAGQVILIAGSVDILVMYVTHAALYTDVLIAGAALAVTVRARFVWQLVASSRLWAVLRRRPRG